MDWAKETGKNAVQGVQDFASKSWDGLKKLYTNIKDSDWAAAFELIKKGVLWVARKIRSALYNPIGLLLDAILLATGIGKSLQFVIWSVVVGLDIYELISGNFEEEGIALPWRLLFLGIDILGLVFAGVAAKGAKGIVGGLIRKFGSSIEGLTNAVKQSKPLQEVVQKILGSTKSANGLMSKAAGYLEKNAPKIYNFLSGSFKAVGTFIQKIVDTLTSILVGTVKTTSKVIHAPGKAVSALVGGGKLGSAASAAVNVALPVTAIGTYEKGKERESYRDMGLNDMQIKNAETMGTTIQQKYNGKDPFDE